MVLQKKAPKRYYQLVIHVVDHANQPADRVEESCSTRGSIDGRIDMLYMQSGQLARMYKYVDPQGSVRYVPLQNVLQ